MKLQRGDKTFMACLEHIPWCIRLCSLDVERSGRKKKKKKSRRAFCCSPESPKTKAGCIKTSVREVTMWTAELCKSENCRQSVQRFWLMFVCLTICLPTPNGSSNKGGKKGGGVVDADCVLILHSFILLIIYMSMHHFSYVTKEVWYWRCSHREW